MKVKPEQAVNAVIAFKKRQRIQTQKEDKIMFDQVKNRKAFDKKKEEMIMKANGLKKKDLEGIRKETQKIFKQSLEAFKKIKRPKKEPALQLLSRYAEPYGHRHPDPRPDPGPGPQQKDITEAICFASATRCDGDLCESQNAAIFPVFESDGVGGYFGNGASVVPADRSNSLFYSFEPAENGTATIIAEVLLTGVVSANTDAMVAAASFFVPGAWGARSTADVKLSLRMNVWQGNTIIASSPDQPVADIHCQDGDSKFLAFRDDFFSLILTTILTQNELILIELTAVANLTGRSQFGIAVVDFGKGQKLDNFDFGIRVPQLCVFFDSPVVNPPY